MVKVWTSVALAVFGLSMVGWNTIRPGDSTRLVVTGSSTVAPLAAEISRLYEAQHPADRVDVQTGGSSRGIADARQGLADVGMVSRSPKDGEDDLIWYPIARDGICLIAHRDNPLTSLTDDQVAAIYRGTLCNWRDLEGADAEITVVNKAEGRSTLEVFLHHFGLQSEEIQADVVVGDNQQGIKTVAANPHAIGYVSIGTAAYEAQRGTPIRLLAANGITASVENLVNGTFPIARTLHLVTQGEPKRPAREFIAMCRSDAVHGLIREQYFVPLAD